MKVKDQSNGYDCRNFKRHLCNRKEIVGSATIIPMPPSKCKENVGYDDRLIKILHKAFADGTCSNIKSLELLYNIGDIATAHASAHYRPDVQTIYENLEVDDILSQQVTVQIIIFDDVLSAGCHYRAASVN